MARSKRRWNLENLRIGFEKFFEENGRYPTASEIDKYTHLPTSRSIERSFGGLVVLRKTLGLTGQRDLRTGVHSTERAHMIGKRAHASELQVYLYLKGLFGEPFVHREYFFADDARTRADFFVYTAEGNFCVDTFFAANYRNVSGCINSKLGKYNAASMRRFPVIFLQMNPEILQREVDLLISRKEKKLTDTQSLLCWEEFEKYCSSRSALKVMSPK
jgi:hypothetical protein